MHVMQAGLLHSVYSTEMFPWRLFKPAERQRLQELAGADVEHLVFLYCTCSQQELYKEVNRLSARKNTLAAGLAVRNFYTGERAVLDARQAARLLVVLAADLMEQDAFFSLHLPCACLRLASPHLQVPPPLWQRLEDSGFYELPRPRLEEIESNARSLLRRGRKWAGRPERACSKKQRAARQAHQGQLEDAAQTAPWLYELSVEAARLGSGNVPVDTHGWCRAWGTRWTQICGPQSAVEYTSLFIKEDLPHATKLQRLQEMPASSSDGQVGKNVRKMQSARAKSPSAASSSPRRTRSWHAPA